MAGVEQPREQQLREVYAAFNARDVDAVLAQTTADVDWPNAWEGGRVRGRDGIREYWGRQWAAIDPTVEPTGFEARADGRLAVSVHQVVRDLDGKLVAENDVCHIYSFREGLIARMDVEE
jgi:hypothetical protein